MNKTLVYILCGESGAYEDIIHWVEGVYLYREDAEYRLDQLNSLINKFIGDRDITELEWDEFREIETKLMNDPLGDPKFNLDYNGVRYTIIESTINTFNRSV